MPQPNATFPTPISSYYVPHLMTEKQRIRHCLISSVKNTMKIFFMAGVSTSILTGCSDLSTQTPPTMPSTNTVPQTQSLEKTQNTLSEPPPEQRSVWVTMANMRCH